MPIGKGQAITIYFPDISDYQRGISLAGAPAAAIKATEGTGYLSRDYGPAIGRAKAAGCFPLAYHFLHAGDPGGQARWCHDHVGTVPLMLDAEPTGSSRPSMGDVYGFTDAYRALGGTLNLCYLPRWYWQQLGSPGLGGLATRKIALWSSSYTGYTDTGPGWRPYGGLTPAIWQYTDAHAFGGQSVDFNAYKGTIGQFRVLASGGAPAPAPPAPGGKAPAFPYPAGHYLGQPSSSPYCHSGWFGGADNANVHTWQTQMTRRGWKIVMDGCYGPGSADACRAFQAEKGLPADGLCGAVTWAASWTAPVT